MIEFLDLDEFAPEILIQKPLLVTKWNSNFDFQTTPDTPPPQAGSYHVSHCHFLTKHNLFVLGLNTSQYDKKGKKLKAGTSMCKLQVFSFKQLSLVRDSLILKHGDAHLLSSATSTTHISSVTSTASVDCVGRTVHYEGRNDF